MISKAIYYHSPTGNTKAIAESVSTLGFDIYNLMKMSPEEVEFNSYNLILIGASTWGRGAPHLFFKKIYPQLSRIENKKIGLFGSGNSIYGDDFCGALDVLDNLLGKKNKILFKYKFEGYPTEKNIKEFESILSNMERK